jgi:hypothetical protein
MIAGGGRPRPRKQVVVHRFWRQIAQGRGLTAGMLPALEPCRDASAR